MGNNFNEALKRKSQSASRHKDYCSYSELCFKSSLVFPQQTMAQYCCMLPSQTQAVNTRLFCPEYASRLESVFPWKSSQWPASLASREPKDNHNFSSFPFSRVVNVHSTLNAIQNALIPPKWVYRAWFNYSQLEVLSL